MTTFSAGNVLTTNTGGNLRLGASSPAINAGDNVYVSGISTDLDGNPRISGGTVDMGVYESPFYTLSVSLTGSGGGSVTASGINCETDCTETYADFTVVKLTASAGTGYTFAGWSGACSGTSDCVVTMSQAQSVTAEFTLDQHTLSVSLEGTGSGSVSSAPDGIDCGTDCTVIYDYGTLVTLTATAGTGSTFEGWSGACTNTSGDCVVTMTEDWTVTATFEPSLPIPPTGSLEVYLPLIQR